MTSTAEQITDRVTSAAGDSTSATRNLVLIGTATALTAVAGSIATKPESHWYKKLDLPSWQPPKAAFPIVWTALYVDIAGVSAATVTKFEQQGRTADAKAYRRALAANLLLNGAWSFLFWRGRTPALAAAEAAVLTLSSADLARRAGIGTEPDDARRGRLMAPYPLWCGFATALSASIAWRNRRR